MTSLFVFVFNFLELTVLSVEYMCVSFVFVFNSDLRLELTVLLVDSMSSHVATMLKVGFTFTKHGKWYLMRESSVLMLVFTV